MIFDCKHCIEQLTWQYKEFLEEGWQKLLWEEFLSCMSQKQDITVSISTYIMAVLAMIIWLDIIRMVVFDTFKFTFKCLKYFIAVAFPISGKTWRQLQCQVRRNVSAHSRVHVATCVCYISLFIHAVYFSDRASHSVYASSSAMLVCNEN